MENILGKRLKQLRLEKNMTQEEFGKQFGIVKSTVSLYESGKSTPDDTIKREIADYFNVTIDYLLGRSDVRNPYSDEYILPDEFTSAEEAMTFILKQPSLMAYGGYSLLDMTEDEILELANDLLFAMRIALEKKKNAK